MAGGPQEVQDACDAALAALATALPRSEVSGSRAQWAAVVASAQRVLDTASAVQDAAIVRLAAIEPEWLDDGTEVESHRALGHMALDAPAIVSGAISVSPLHAERRVRAAVRMAADGPAGTPTATGLRGLHEAMAAGRLDAYRAGVVADELEEAPPEVAATVVGALAEYLDHEDAAHLRRRCRRVLARISPDLLVQRARRARAECGLRRFVDEPGVDRWEGTFPSEEAAQAWAAIDALAQQYVADGVCPGIERARAKALTDLVAGNATITAVVTLTVPAAGLPEGQVAPVPGSVALEDDPSTPGSQVLVPTLATGIAGTALADDASTAPNPPLLDVGSGGDLVQVVGLAGSQPVLVPRDWIGRTVQEQRRRGGAGIAVVACDPRTGGLLDQDLRRLAQPRVTTPEATAGREELDRYRPSRAVVRRVKARDRRCRFPGCTVAAVFCDVDHVRPWPGGPTTLANLMCLCRRHHRVKQRRGWRVTLAPDGVVTWTDPVGRVRTTLPADALHTVVLPGAALPPEPEPSSTSRALTVPPDGPYSALEFELEHAGTPAAARPGRWGPPRGSGGWPPTCRRAPVDAHRPRRVLLLDLGSPELRRHRRPSRLSTADDPPPF